MQCAAKQKMVSVTFGDRLYEGNELQISQLTPRAKKMDLRWPRNTQDRQPVDIKSNRMVIKEWGNAGEKCGALDEVMKFGSLQG